jgi:hypothetical protein
MALLHKAELHPTKLELLTGWLPAQPWMPSRVDDHGQAEPLERVAAFRFDDPAGEVGIETLLIQSGDAPVVQVPLTYRAAPLAGGEQWLIGTMHHSVLGERWVYDASGDPVYASALATAILIGSSEAAQYYEVDGRREAVPSTARVVGSGTVDAQVDPIRSLEVENGPVTTVVRAGVITLTILRTPTTASGLPTGQAPHEPTPAPTGTATVATLTATWDGHPQPVVLATAG